MLGLRCSSFSWIANAAWPLVQTAAGMAHEPERVGSVSWGFNSVSEGDTHHTYMGAAR